MIIIGVLGCMLSVYTGYLLICKIAPNWIVPNWIGSFFVTNRLRWNNINVDRNGDFVREVAEHCASFASLYFVMSKHTNRYCVWRTQYFKYINLYSKIIIKIHQKKLDAPENIHFNDVKNIMVKHNI